MVYLFNASDTIGQGIILFNQNISGGMFLTLLLFIIVLIVMAFALKISPTFVLLLLFPLVIVFVAFNMQFLVIGGIFAIMMGMILGYNFFFT